MNLGAAFVEILPNLKKWGSQLRADIAKASNPALAEGERKFSGFVSRVKASLFSLKGAMGVAFGSAAVGIVAKFGLQTAAALQQASISFETLLGSATKAKSFLEELKTFAASTPFELQGVIDASRQLLGAGAAAKDVIPTLRAYGDASGALGLTQEQFQRIMLAVTQSMTKGKLQAEELMQITEAGIPVYSLLSKALGKPVAEIQKMSSEGKLLSADVLPKLQAQMAKDYGGAMAKQANTLTGLWSTLSDTFKLGLADALQPLVPVLTSVLPGAISSLGAAFKTGSLSIAAFIEALKNGDVTSDGVVGGAERLGAAIRNTAIYAKEAAGELFGFYKEHQTLIEATTAALVTMFATFKLYQAGVTAVRALNVAMLALRASVISTTAAMLANPIGLIVLAIVGLIAALVVLYKRNEDFRRIVNQVWAAIKTAIAGTIQFLTPYWNSFIAAMRSVGEWAIKMYQQYIVPSFGYIQTAVGFLVKYVQFYFNLWVTAVKVLAAIFTWLWEQIIQPTFQYIEIAVKVLWAALQIAFGAIRIQLKILGDAFSLLWKVIRPVIHAVGDVIVWLWKNVTEPNLKLIGNFIKGTWDNVIKPTFNALRDFIANKVAPAFKTGVDAITKAWEKVREAARAPIRFIVNTVINQGIIDTWNKIAGFFGVNKVGHVDLPKGFARGGKVNVPTAIVGEGNTSRPEYVIPTDPRHRSRALALYSELGSELMAGGGIIGKAKGLVGGAVDFFTNPVGSLKKAFGGALGALGNIGSGAFGQLVASVPRKMIDGMINFLKGKAGGLLGGGGKNAIGWQAMMRILRARFPGLPLISGYRPGAITATGNVSYHSKGRAVDIPPRMDVFNWIAQNFGKKTKELIYSPAGINQIKNGVRHMYTGITRAMHFNHVHWALDKGGFLPPGMSTVYNGTGKPELTAPDDVLERAFYRALMRAIEETGMGTLVVDGEEFKKVIRIEARKEDARSATALKVGRR